MRLAVHAQPGARCDQIAGLHGGRLKVKVSAPPEDGRANERIIDLLAAAFGLKRRQVMLVSGQASRVKEFLLEGLTFEQAGHALAALSSGEPGSMDEDATPAASHADDSR